MIKDNEEKSAITLVRKIIMKEMDLENDRIHIYNQKWNIPTDEGLFITLQFLGAHPYSNRSAVEDRGADGFWEVQDLNQQELIQIKIMSRNEEALFKKHRVLMALASVYSQQIQEANSFKIAVIPSQFQDISEVEGTARINVYVMTIAILAWYKEEKQIEYYDSFKGEVNTEQQKITFDQPTSDPN